MSTPPISTSPAEPYERTIRTSSLREALVKLNANISYEELIKAVREVDEAVRAEECKVQVDREFLPPFKFALISF